MKLAFVSVAGALALASACFAQGRMIAVDSSRALFEIDINTGAKTAIGTVSANAGTTGGLAYDCDTGTIYLTSTSLDSLFTLDLATGNATLVGAYGDSTIVMHGLEFDSNARVLYGGSNGNLFVINTATGVATQVGTSGLTSFTNLGYNSDTDTMYATNSGTDSFYLVDRASGAMTLIGALAGPTNPNGLAYNPDNGNLYLIDNTTDSLYTINTSTGAATLIGAMGTGNLLGLVYIPVSCGGSGNPFGVGSVTPSSVSNCGDQSVLVSVTVTAGDPPAPPHTVVANLSTIGGSSTQTLFDDGAHEDGAANDGVFAFRQAISYTVGAGPKTITFTVSDNDNRSTNGATGATVTACTQLGACCVGQTCSILSGPACAAQSGSFQGVGTDCGAVSYTISPGGGSFEDISSSGTLAATASACDDCMELNVPIGFNFTFYENSYTSLNISSNANVQFGGTSTTFTNTAIPNVAVPNNAIYPMWDDLNPGVAGDIFYQTLGSSPNQRFIVQWNNCTQFALTTSETFQLVLFEGSNDIEFRYAVITPETPAGDYTVGVENSTGTLATSIPGATIGSDAVFTVDYNLSSNPCTPSCFYTDCSWSTDCCPFDFNGSGGTPDDADVTTFFTAWNAGEHCADVNLSEGTPDDADISTFFTGWNAGGC